MLILKKFPRWKRRSWFSSAEEQAVKTEGKSSKPWSSHSGTEGIG